MCKSFKALQLNQESTNLQRRFLLHTIVDFDLDMGKQENVSIQIYLATREISMQTRISWLYSPGRTDFDV